MKLKFLLVFVLLFLVGCEKPSEIEPPKPVEEVTSVTINYNDQAVTSGVLRVDLSSGQINISTTVTKTEGANGEVSYTSSDSNVATVDAGKITLHSEGETVISALAGGKTHNIVLIVEDSISQTETYDITVDGGLASVASAAPGEYVSLEVVAPEHMSFVKWEFKVGGIVSSIWTNANVFKMPADDIEIKAIYEDKLYTLSVVNATVFGEDTSEVIDGVNIYKFTYGTEIILQADAEPEGMMFVGFDYQSKKNRRGTLGEMILEAFQMPDESLAVWAVYSEASGLDLGNGYPESVPFSNPLHGFKVITDGTATGEVADPDLEGMDGFRFGIPANHQVVDPGDYGVENIQGSNLSNSEKGSFTLKAIFKNHHSSLPITVEFYATYHGARTTTGIITIPANSVVTKYFLANLGFNNPWMGFVVREATNLPAGDVINLSLVVEKAATYPDGDIQFEVSGNANWVEIENYTETNWGKEKIVNNDLGMSIISTYAQSIGLNGYVTAKINNLPNNPDKIYFRVINATENVGTYRFVVGKSNNPLTGEDVISYYDLELEAFGVAVFALDVTDAATYFSIVKNVADGSGLYGHTFVLQMAYNNVFNLDE